MEVRGMRYTYGIQSPVDVEASSVTEFFDKLSKTKYFGFVVNNSYELRQRLCKFYVDTLAGVEPENEQEIFDKLLDKGVILRWQ
tara:strand:+ start:104 stop:355 length:252 start_codon:yes stop_codon:yes gene_type:complete